MVRLLVILCENCSLNKTYLELDILHKACDSCTAGKCTSSGSMRESC